MSTQQRPGGGAASPDDRDDRDDRGGDGGREVSYRGPTHVVRPRWSWAGLGLLLLGGAVAGFGVAVTSVPWLVAGAVLLALGAVGALRGNLFYDVEGRGAAFADEESREMPGARAEVDDPEVRADAAARGRELEEVRTRQGVRPSLRRPAAGLLVLVGVWLFATQGMFYENEPAGRTGTYRALSMGLLLALPALYLFLVRSSVVAAAVCLVAGVGLVLGGLLSDPGDLRGAVSEVVSGVIVLVAAPVAAMPALRGRRGTHRA